MLFRVLLEARSVPARTDVTKRTGEKVYRMIDEIRVFDQRQTPTGDPISPKPRLIPPPTNHRFLIDRNGDVNTIHQDTYVLVNVTADQMSDLEQGMMS